MLILAVAEAVQVTDPITINSLGVPAIFVILVLREVFAYTKGKKITNGYQRKASCDEIVKRFDKDFESQDKRFDKVDKQLDEVKILIVKNGN